MNDIASIALLRTQPSRDGFELFFMRRTGEAYGFPGGTIHDGEHAQVAAARTLFEACGALIARDAGQAAETLEMPSFAKLRRQIRAGAHATELLRSVGLTWASEALLPWSQWVTPSIEAVRTSMRIFVAELPAGLVPTFDKTDTVASLWLRPAEAPSRASELRLPPALVRTCHELAQHASVAELRAAARARAEEPHPVLPRLAANVGGSSSMCLLLPWDPDYETAGQGESHPYSYKPSWATGPSRFVLEDRTWKHVAAPGSTSAG
jgi:8-oxo-dGTP pyrophosphatase MutT (NUDIX family)